MKGRATFFRPETIVASFLRFMVLLPKGLFNHSNYSILTLNNVHEFEKYLREVEHAQTKDRQTEEINVFQVHWKLFKVVPNNLNKKLVFHYLVLEKL